MRPAGIGAAVATDLADRGATVYAGARGPAGVTDGRVRAVRLDVTDADERAAAVERVDRGPVGSRPGEQRRAGAAGRPLHEDPPWR